MTFTCSTTYLIRPTESNDPACGYLTMALGHLSQHEAAKDRFVKIDGSSNLLLPGKRHVRSSG